MNYYNHKTMPYILILLLLFFDFLSLKKVKFGKLAPDNGVGYRVIIKHYGIDGLQIERNITIPLENRLMSLSGVQELSSVSELNQSRINIQLRDSTDPGDFFLMLRDIVDDFYTTLPSSVQRPEILSSFGGENTIFRVAFFPETSGLSSLRERVEREFKSSLSQIEGVGEVQVLGGEKEEIHICLDSYKIKKNNLRFIDISKALNLNYGNSLVGLKRDEMKWFPVILKGSLKTLNDLKEFKIPLKNDSILALKNLGTLGFQPRKSESISRLNGKKMILLSISSSGIRSPVYISGKINKRLNAGGIRNYKILYDKGKLIKRSIKSMIISLVLSMGVLFLFLFLFSSSLHNTFLLVFSIPLIVFTSMGVLFRINIPLDTPLLGGIGMGIGLMADMGIILIENPDKPKKGLPHVFFPLLISTLTTLGALVPLFYINSIDDSIREIILSFSTLLIVTFIINFLLLPPFLKIKKENRSFLNLKRGVYIKNYLFWKIHWFVRVYKSYFTMLCFILFALFFIFIFTLPRYRDKGEESEYLFAQVYFDLGTSVFAVDNQLCFLIKRINTFTQDLTLESIARRSHGSLMVKFNKKNISRKQLSQKILKLNKECQSGFIYMDLEGESGQQVKLDLVGPDYQYLEKRTKDLASYLQEKRYVSQVVLHFKGPEQQLHFIPLYKKLSLSGIPLSSIAEYLRWGLHGPVSLKWIKNDQEVDLRVMGIKEQFQSFSALQEETFNKDGHKIKLSHLGSFALTRGQSKIYRINRQRSLTLSLHTKEKNLNLLIDTLENDLSLFPLKDGFSIRIDPQLYRDLRGTKKLLLSLVLALIFIYLIIAIQYESFFIPFFVFLTIPLSLSFSLLLFYMVKIPLSSNALLALVVASGLVVNNIILILDDLTHRPLGVLLPIQISLSLRRRLKPLLLTTGSTLIGLLPLLLFKISQFSLFSILSLVIIAGVIGSFLITFLALYPLIIKFPFCLRVFHYRNTKYL